MPGEALKDFLTEIGGHEWVTVRVRPHLAQQLVRVNTGHAGADKITDDVIKAKWEFVDSALAEKYHAVLNPLPAP